MDKIKHNIPPLGERIRAVIFENPLATTKLRLRIAENIFILVAFLYFFATLMTIGWLFPEVASMLVFLLFPILALTILALIYSLINYAVAVYAESLLFIRFPLLLWLAVVYLALLAYHLKLYPSLLSLAWIS